MISIANHLWQNTVFAIVAAVFATLLRSYSARLRFWVWFVASAKFLVPFSLLITMGARSAYPPSQPQQNVSSRLPATVRLAQPFGLDLPLMTTPEPAPSKLGPRSQL
jgi:bla regulator protein BlaR1